MAKLLFLVTEDWYFLSHRLPLALAAKKAGYEVVVATRVGESARSIEAEGIRVVPFEMDRRNMNPLKELGALSRLTWLLRREKPDLLHMVALKPVLLGNMAARLAGVKRRISAVAGMGFLFTSDGRGGVAMPLVSWLLGRALRGSQVIVQNPDDARLLEQMGIANGTMRLIRGSGVDLKRFRPRPEPMGTPVVMLPSRLLWDKGVGEFVEAARRLQRAGIGARFVLVGAPDAANPASVKEGEVIRWRSEGIVEWWGHRNDMEETLPQANLVCLPSYREGLPKVLLEAMGCGRAIVTCDVPGCREVVSPGENGLLVPPGDAAALADAIQALLEDTELRRRLGRRGRERAEEEFGVERVVEQTMGIYQRLGFNQPWP